MKKLLVAGLAALISVAFITPVSALENTFGGYWRTRAYTQQNFTGEDETEAKDLTQVDTRTRLYYTAKINDNLKLVNKFEFDAIWGDNTSYGDIGADAVRVEIKNTYADFNLADYNFKVGTQGRVLHRGFLFDDDFSGAQITYKGSTFDIPFIWIKTVEGGEGKDANDDDFDYYTIAPSFSIGDTMTIVPSVLWATSEATDTDLFFIGVDFDAKFDAASLWFTGIYEGGDVSDDIEASAWLAAIGGDVELGMASVHGQIFYASGDDDLTDDDEEGFAVVNSDRDTFSGQSYYWAEIMGLGLFDNRANDSACGDLVTNIIAYNIGATFKPIDKLKLTADLWYAELAEAPGDSDEDLGFEVDLRLTYQLVEGLNLDVVAAYLFAGDATEIAPDEADPIEVGTQLSLAF